MDTVTHCGTTYRLPFAGLLRPLTPDERSGLADSIRANGILHTVLLYDSPTHGLNCVVDGGHRTELAAELDVDHLPTRHLKHLNDDSARELAESLNLDRRHIAPEEQQRRRAERVKRVTAARAGGKSLRTIAHEEGVDEKTVRKDIATAGADGSAPEPEKVTGKDGKTYSATAPRPASPPPPPPPAAPPPPPVETRPPPHETKTRRGKPAAAGVGGEVSRFPCVERAFGSLVREIDHYARAAGVSNSQSHRQALDLAEQLLGHLKRWNVRTGKKPKAR